MRVFMFKYLRPIFLFFMLTTLAWAQTDQNPNLVLDMSNSPQLPKRFRTFQDILSNQINTTGLKELKIAGGGQFSKLAFDKILERLKAKQIIVFDLRQESHGMLNGNAISWYGVRDAANAGLSPLQVEEVQASLLDNLSQQEMVTVQRIIKKSFNGEIEKSRPIEYFVHQVSTEGNYVLEKGSQYYRIDVQDFHAPTPNVVNQFLAIYKNLPKDKWIYFHCRGGSGRTTVFMTMVDMLHNAKKLSLDDILARQAALGGKNFGDLPPKDNFKYKAAVARLNFVKEFYQYAHENNDNFKTSFTKWLMTKNHS
jgi:hypothetical protein